jgi:hypothetical protein
MVNQTVDFKEFLDNFDSHAYNQTSPAVSMKNVVFCDIKTQIVPHRRNIKSPLQSPAG